MNEIAHRYTAYDAAGNTISGEITARDKREAEGKIRAQSQYPLKVTTVREGGIKALLQSNHATSSKKQNQQITLEFCQELSMLMQAGFLVADSLAILGEQSKSKIASIAENILGKISDGHSFGQAVSELHPQFPDDLIAIIRSGEATNSLGKSIEKYHTIGVSQHNLKRELVTALIYPAFILSLALIVITIIAFTLAPALADLFEAENQPLPIPLWILNAYYEFASQYYQPILAIFILGLLGGLYFLNSKKNSERTRSTLLFRIPFLGSILRNWELAKLSGTLGMLLENKVPVLEALKLSETSTSASNYSKAIAYAIGLVESGEDLSSALSEQGIFPSIFLNSIQIGERTNTLASSLNRLSDLFSKQSEKSGKILTSVLTPALTIITGILIGFIVLSTMNALLSINELAL